MNRIESAIGRMKSHIESLRLSPERLKSTSDGLDLSPRDHAAFQEFKSLMFASGRLNFEEATLLYRYLGHSANHFNAQPIEVKGVITKVMGELLGVGK